MGHGIHSLANTIFGEWNQNTVAFTLLPTSIRLECPTIALMTFGPVSKQPDEHPPNMTSEECHWMLVEDFVQFINDKMERFFSPSSWMCIDESISHWHGTGGDWINEGLSMHDAMTANWKMDAKSRMRVMV